MTHSFRAYCAAAVIAMSAAPVMVMAQSAPATAQAPAQMQSAITPSDAQLKKFAMASQKVSVLANEYRPKLQAAQDEPTREKVYREADEKMVKVVQDDGLTVEEFNGISQAIEQDPQLRQRAIEIAQRHAPQGVPSTQ
jgi:predicted metal-dependent RNase